MNTGKKTIRIATTEQRLSAHAGQTTFWAFLHLRKVRALLAGLLPHRLTSPNAHDPVDTALGFIAGILAGADKLARVAHLRGDPVLPEVMAVRTLPTREQALALLRALRRAGEKSARLSHAVALGHGAAAQPPGRLHPRPRQHGAAPRRPRRRRGIVGGWKWARRPPGRRAHRPHPRRLEAVPAAAARGARRGQAGRAVLAAPRQRALLEQPHRLHPRTARATCRATCACG